MKHYRHQCMFDFRKYPILWLNDSMGDGVMTDTGNMEDNKLWDVVSKVYLNEVAKMLISGILIKAQDEIWKIFYNKLMAS